MDMEDFPTPGVHMAGEIVTASTHAATHMDAPWHYGPTSGGSPARTIDQVPLEWCFGNGVVLDVSYKKPNEIITVEDLQDVLKKINYTIEPLDIVLIRTDAWKLLENKSEGWRFQPGMSSEATLWLIDKGVKVIGIDAYSFDRSIPDMLIDLRDGYTEMFFPAHYAGRVKEYCQIEKLAHLDKIPKPYDFLVSALPIKIAKGSGAWVRAIAIIEK
jgi:kynurenine formamidase